MKTEVILTISDRHRVNTENVRITGHTHEGKKYTFHLLGENAWWFETSFKAGTQIILCPIETYEIYTGTPETPIRIPPENIIHIKKEIADTE